MGTAEGIVSAILSVGFPFIVAVCIVTMSGVFGRRK